MSNLTHPHLGNLDEASPSQAPEAAVITDVSATKEMAATAAERKRLYQMAGVLLAVGAAALGISLGAAAIAMPARIIVAIIGLAGIYMGARRIGLARIGRDFDLTYVLSCTWLVVLITTAIIAPILPLGEYKDTSKLVGVKGNQPPNLFSANPLGTNNDALDLLSRSIYGSRYSLVVAISAVLIGLVIGGTIGIVAGYFGGKIDAVIGVFTNSLLAVPALILLIAISAVMAPTLQNVAFALALLAIPSMIRIARANTLSFSQQEFVLAARAMGASRWRVMVRELAPNVALPLASLGMVLISVMIVAEASLSFLGLGIKPPTPTWGNMIAEGNGGKFEKFPFLVLVPGVFLFLTVFAFNIVGEKAQKATSGGKEVKL